MNKSLNTTTTLFESVSSLSKAIPKLANKSVGGLGQPVIIYSTPLKWGQKLKVGEYIYKFPRDVIIPTEEDLIKIIGKYKSKYLSKEFINECLEIFKTRNKLNPSGLIESIEPGIIYWFDKIEEGEELYYIETIIPKFNDYEINNFLNGCTFLSPYMVFKNYILMLSRRNCWQVNCF